MTVVSRCSVESGFHYRIAIATVEWRWGVWEGDDWVVSVIVVVFV